MGHGRVEERSVIYRPADPLASDFPFSRSIVCIVSCFTHKRTGKETTEKRFYLSSQDPQERTPEQWLNLSRDHWAGVEIRNHWRRDATLGEDSTRCKNPIIVANLALLRSAGLTLFQQLSFISPAWLPPKREVCAANSAIPFNLVTGNLGR